MNPRYSFRLNGTQSFPVYGNISKDFDKESNQEFFRAKLSGKLNFIGADYDYIVAQDFDFEFLVDIYISYDNGATASLYWSGKFYKTDCEFDNDSKTVTVTPTVLDKYNDVLAGIEKEYNLIDLLPEIIPVKADKRPMVQIYIPGESVISCFLSGMYWEQDCDVVNESDTIRIGNTNYPALTDKYFFSLNRSFLIGDISGTMSPQLPDIFTGVFDGSKFNPNRMGTQDFTSGNYTFRYYFNVGIGGYTWRWQILNSNNTVLWQYMETGGGSPSISLPMAVTLTPVSGSGASGNVSLYLHETPIYARYVLDVNTIAGVTTNELPADDLVPNNRNYHRAIGYSITDVAYLSTRLTNNPTEWGVYQPGQYYQEPYVFGGATFFPIARSDWGRVSYWFSFSSLDWYLEEQGRAEFTLRDAYPLDSVISVLLNKIAPDISHAGTVDYSQFLYGTNPISGITQKILITPKSNVINSGYDQPAQKASIKLKDITDMLRDCFRCYWFIDNQDRFRIEHIEFFRNGGAYNGTPIVGIDLTAQVAPRSGKDLSFGQNKYTFEKPDMAERYQFGWMDDVTRLFEGYPINILSKYVEPGKIENINISQFTSDFDYILLNPSVISKDGFVLLSAIYNNNEYRLPYVNFPDNGADNRLQNAYVAFVYLQMYYGLDMPAKDYEIHGVQMEAGGVKKLKIQSIKFPAQTDPDLMQLIKTGIGNGMIKKLSVNLSSRDANVTLCYDIT